MGTSRSQLLVCSIVAVHVVHAKRAAEELEEEQSADTTVQTSVALNNTATVATVNAHWMTKDNDEKPYLGNTDSEGEDCSGYKFQALHWDIDPSTERALEKTAEQTDGSSGCPRVQHMKPDSCRAVCTPSERKANIKDNGVRWACDIQSGTQGEFCQKSSRKCKINTCGQASTTAVGGAKASQKDEGITGAVVGAGAAVVGAAGDIVTGTLATLMGEDTSSNKGRKGTQAKK